MATIMNGDCCGVIRLRKKYGSLLYNHLLNIIFCSILNLSLQKETVKIVYYCEDSGSMGICTKINQMI